MSFLIPNMPPSGPNRGLQLVLCFTSVLIIQLIMGHRR